MAGSPDTDANYLSATVDVGAEGFVNFAADGREALGKFGRGESIAWKSLVVKLFNLLKLAGL
ncbi:MAG: hypothetical protein QQW96_04925 [Tychonema bourrellyi B0820]|uniref:hypothetical protein n=1 Tax=Tychonema bourrellyi TaxID=54313 RepID=UPI001FE7ECB8|nr:hypothetical protein [Tychonema bourrellyi]MDQ2096973.1 hypothetical protein [Tychonema bourrellyi B0820]